MKKYLTLFFTMLKIGLFTFGGGYAMLSLLEHEFVDKKHWLAHDEFVDMVALAESTPGPIAINAATYIGYRVGKLFGAILCTVGVCIPSFAIIFVISLFFEQFLSIGWVAAAFRGIQIGVTFLIATAGIRFFRKLPKTAFSITVFGATLLCAVTFSLFSIQFSAIFYILISAALGLLLYLIGYFVSKRKTPAPSSLQDTAAQDADADPADGATDATDGSDETVAQMRVDPPEQMTTDAKDGPHGEVEP